RVEAQTLLAVNDINAIRNGDVIGAAGVGAGLVGEVVVEGAYAGQLGLPEHAARVDVHRPQHVDAFDEQPAVEHLRLRAVAVPGQDAVVRRATEPEDSQGGLDQLVFRDARVGGVGVLVRPVGGAGQHPFAR